MVDPKNLLHKLLPFDDIIFPLAGSIDLYGDTVFNRLQMKRFILEWAEISKKAQTTEARDLVSKIESLASSCAERLHLYLKFIGD
ncbi:MAG TPA: hypothetical protein VK737_05190 [Opitutales bacterium]|nr:hypothetical protein [Opitutales bacterium]